MDRTRHCIIVASVRCVPVPPARYKEWGGLRVSVLLMGPEKYVNDLSSEQWKQWLDFCSQGQERLAVLTERAGNSPDEQVLQRLREYLRDWTQPQYPTKK